MYFFSKDIYLSPKESFGYLITVKGKVRNVETTQMNPIKEYISMNKNYRQKNVKAMLELM